MADGHQNPSGVIDARPGVVAAVLVMSLYGGLALSVNFPRAAVGFQSDGATYYLMTHSLAADTDLVYRREDLARVWREFSAGPTGIFLKKGRDLDLTVDARPPFLHVTSAPDPDLTRLYFGKSFIYPMFAAPWVRVFGTNGFLLFHACLLGLVTLAGYLFLSARMAPASAVLLAAGFLAASVAPSYVVWTTPEVFNFATIFLGYFCWLYREVASPSTAPRWARWLLLPRADLLGTVLIAIAACSKVSNALLIVPLLVSLAWRRQWRRAAVCAVVFGLVGVMFLLANIGIAGDWNFQGGERRTYETAFPFLPGGAGFDVGMDRATNRVMTEVIFDPRVFWTVFSHNLVYYVIGRHSGLLPYFFPAVFAVVAFALARGRRAAWQYLVLAAALAEILLFVVWIPYDYYGGGGVLGNRYFMNMYGLFLFLLPPINSLTAAVVPWIVGGLFTAQITLNPFVSSSHPAEHAMHGPLRWLPVELSLVNNLPITTTDSRVRVRFGEQHPFQMYFLDNHALPPERDARSFDGTSFWVAGESTAECLVRSATPMKRLALMLTNGDRANRVSVRVAGRSRVVNLQPNAVSAVTLPLDEGFPYQGSRVWRLTVTSASGFVPMFTRGGVDFRFLGVQVKPELLP